MEISWKDGLIDNNRDIEYFPQSYMYKLAKSLNNELDILIEGIIKQNNDKEKLINDYKAFSSETNTEIINKINKLFQLIKDINEKKILLKEKGDKKGIETEIDKLNSELLELENKSQISAEELEKYNELKSNHDSLVKTLQNIKEEILKIDSLKSVFFTNKEIDFALVSLQENNREAIKASFEKLNIDFQERWEAELKKIIVENESHEEHTQKSIELIISNEIYKIGIHAFHNNAQFKQTEEKLKLQKDKLADIIRIEEGVSTLDNQIKTFVIGIKNTNHQYLEKIEIIGDSLFMLREELEIKAVPRFKKEAFKNLLNRSINQQSYQGQEIVNRPIDTIPDFFDHLNTIFDKLAKNYITLKGNYNNINLSQELMSTNFFDISYDIVYEDKFSMMSEGKKAFVVLMLLLDFNNKSCPILIDQPEDDLDNRAIFKDLVKYLKRKKRERQILLVTHNSNIVVSSDSELIIVANQNGANTPNKNGSKFQYISGSIENTIKRKETFTVLLSSQGVREHVCDILEGGDEAFKLREKKYSIIEF